jgi:hypothetical protein
VTGCRITRLRCTPGGRNAPFTLTTTCGWSTPVVQGTAWAAHPARDRWLTHPCTARKEMTA